MIYESLLVSLVFLIHTDLAIAQIVCANNGNYTNNSNNVNTTLFSLSTNIPINGFYNTSTGQGSNTVNAIALCRGDLQLNDCRDCLQTAAAELVKSCPNQKQAIRWDASCMLRYSNDTIYGIMAIFPGYYLWNQQNSTSPQQFNADLRGLLDNIRKEAAAGGSLMKVGAGNATAPDFQTIFGLVQCTPDLSSDDCTSCLVGAISEIPLCCDGKIGGRVLRPSCNLRFETYPFFNETRLQELQHPPGPPIAVPPPPASEPPTQPSPGKKKGNTTRTIIIIMAAIGACMVLAASVVICLRKRKKHEQTANPENIDEISRTESLQYAFSIVKAATNDFSHNNKLGQGGFGTVYKGKLPNGQEIAVKRLSMDSGQGDLEFKNEVLLLAKLQHRNLVRLLGFALEGMEKLLVYEFVENASLDQVIFDPINHSKLDWERRYKIIVGIARGILYLHEDSRLRIIHRDLKASNILLDQDMNPKISDFGMARLFGQDETQGNTSRVVGTYGYMPPEYLIHGQFSIKSDVFSFGVLVLELISGRKNNSFPSGESVVDLVSFAWKSWEEGRAANVVDPFLKSGSGSINEMLRCIHIGLLCVQEDAADRPTMASVVLMLSSFSLTLALPSHPAFYSGIAYASDIQDFSSTNSDHNKHSRSEHHSSPNDDSNSTDLYPR